MLSPRCIYNLSWRNSMSELLRVAVTGPQYRADILAYSYSLCYEKDSNECVLKVNGPHDMLEIGYPYEDAGKYTIDVATVGGMNKASLLLSCVHPEESES